jgi:hypothetical protein
VLDGLAAFRDVLDEDGERRGQNLDSVVSEYPGGGDLAVEPGFLTHFAQDGLDGILVWVDVTAGRHPPAELGVLDQQDGVLVQDDTGGREVADHDVPPVLTAMARTLSAMDFTWLAVRPG